MPRIDIDATEGFALQQPDEGTYLARIEEVGDIQQGPKARYVEVAFTFEDTEGNLRKLTRNYPVEGKGSSFLVDLFNKATGANLEPGEVHGIDTEDMLQQEVQIVVKHEEYEGEARAKVQRVLPA